MSEALNETMRTVDVVFFAILREQAGCSEASIETTAATPADLYGELAARYGLTFPLEALQVAVNETFAPMNSQLKNGDQVVFIPPVAGG